MERRVAPLAALVIALTAGGAAFAGASVPASAPLAAVAWPVSTLLVSEVQTGGASASDEFAEITNVGTASVDLAGLEIVYVTSTGSTVTRKASWSTQQLLGPGRHLFIANTASIYAGLADATYSGGFAATGGAIVLRAIGGATIDGVGWGDATNAFVEGAPVAAAAANASIERNPGGISGNTTDTNVNATDWFAQAAPNPQSLAAPPVPAPGPSPTLLPTVAPTASPTATPTPQPSATPAATSAAPTDTPTPTAPSATPTAEPAPTATAIPTPTPTPLPTLAPTPTPTPTPAATPAPTATPPPSVSIVEARGQASGTTARITGVLTTHLGALESGHKAFIQDDTAGIAIYLDTAVTAAMPADTLVSVVGTVDDRFAERTLRVNVTDIVNLGEQQRPPPWERVTGAISEAVEGARVIVQGVTVGSPTDLSDGLGLMVDDGTGEVRVIVGPEALGGRGVPGGTQIVAVGPVGQRDSSGTGLAGYRVHATEESDFGILVPPTPGPTASPAPTPAPTAGPTATPMTTSVPTATPSTTATLGPTPVPTLAPTPTPVPTATPRPTASPSPTATPSGTPAPSQPPTLSIVEARGAPVGTVVTIAGVVIAEGGRLGSPPLIAIADGTGGIAVRLPDGVTSPVRGTTVEVKGALADPYGQLELRPRGTGFRVTGRGSLPSPVQLSARELGEATEGRLAELSGTVSATPRKGTSGDLTIDVVDGAGTSFRVIADGSSQILATDLVKGRSYRLTGIVGQRASRKGALDGYRLQLRDRSDIAGIATGPGGPGASPGPGASGAPASGSPASVTPISTALALADGSQLIVEATVTAGVSLLDSSGRRVVVQDATGAIEIFLPSGSAMPAVGSRLRVTGSTGHAWGAPRIAATSVQSIGGGSGVSPKALGRAPAERDEWLLVRLSGTVLNVERLGDRWRAEIALADGTKAPVHGQAGAGIPSTAIVVGRKVTVTGIVKRPYPTASDRRFALLPRNGNDVSIGSGGNGAGGTLAGATTAGSSSERRANDRSPATDITPDTDLAVLMERVGERVRVGGLIARLAPDGFDLDDGTALARVELHGDMASLLAHLREGEAVAATGLVKVVDGASIVIVDADGSLVRVGALGQAVPVGGASAANPDPTNQGGAPALTADSSGLAPSVPPTSVLAMIGISVLSLIVTLLRRRFVRRRLRVALVDRLATLRAKSG